MGEAAAEAVLVAAEPLSVRTLGSLPYREALQLQQELAEKRRRGRIGDTLLLLEHPPVFTVGRDARDLNLLVPRASLPGLGIELVEVDRGGDITYHGPGQLVGYPIVDLREHGRDVRRYVGALERMICAVLAAFGVSADVVPGLRGVWVRDRKIAAIGIHVSGWVTTHGFALNVANDLRPFDYIVPCGIHGRSVTSLVREVPRLAGDDVMTRVMGAVDGAFRRELGREAAHG